jgi:hypothetical protein
MQFIGLSRGRDIEGNDEVGKYELRLNEQEISCIYKDRYGIYLCTRQGKMMKVDHTVAYLREELGI